MNGLSWSALAVGSFLLTCLIHSIPEPRAHDALRRLSQTVHIARPIALYDYRADVGRPITLIRDGSPIPGLLA